MNGLPTPRTTLRARHVTRLVWCKGGCQHQAHADLQKLIDAGRGDVPLQDKPPTLAQCKAAGGKSWSGITQAYCTNIP